MMKLRFVLPALALALASTLATHAQAPAGAPTGSNGVCNDGTYSMAAVKSGACGGHKGVKSWYGPAAAPKPASAKPTATTSTPATTAPAAKATPASVAKPAPVAASTPVSTQAPSPKAAPAVKPSTSTAAAPGGGPGMVWINTATKVYHCPGDRYYGKTKAGQYMTEAAARASGGKPDAGKPCSK